MDLFDEVGPDLDDAEALEGDTGCGLALEGVDGAQGRGLQDQRAVVVPPVALVQRLVQREGVRRHLQGWTAPPSQKKTKQNCKMHTATWTLSSCAEASTTYKSSCCGPFPMLSEPTTRRRLSLLR